MRLVLAALVIVAFSGSVWPAVAVTEEQQANGRPSNRGGLTFQSNNPNPDDVRALERSGEGDNAEARQSWRRLLDGEREAADQSVATRRDSLLNGLLIGAAAGAALGRSPTTSTTARNATTRCTHRSRWAQGSVYSSTPCARTNGPGTHRSGAFRWMSPFGHEASAFERQSDGNRPGRTCRATRTSIDRALSKALPARAISRQISTGETRSQCATPRQPGWPDGRASNAGPR
jgi:hypothetical protein